MKTKLFSLFVIVALLAACSPKVPATAPATPTATKTVIATPVVPTIVPTPQGTLITTTATRNAFLNAIYHQFNGNRKTVCETSDGTIKGSIHTEKGITVREIWFKSDDSPIYMIASDGTHIGLWAMGAIYGYTDFTNLAEKADDIKSKYPEVSQFLPPDDLTINCTPGVKPPSYVGYETLVKYDRYFEVGSTYYVTGKGMKFSCQNQNHDFFEYGEYKFYGITYKVWHYAPKNFANHILKVETDYDTRHFEKFEDTDGLWHYASLKSSQTIDGLIIDLPKTFLCTDNN